jgi:hypothetical protein
LNGKKTKACELSGIFYGDKCLLHNIPSVRQAEYSATGTADFTENGKRQIRLCGI